MQIFIFIEISERIILQMYFYKFKAIFINLKLFLSSNLKLNKHLYLCFKFNPTNQGPNYSYIFFLSTLQRSIIN